MPKQSACRIERSKTSRGMSRAQYEVDRKPYTPSRSSRAGSVLIVKPSRVHSWDIGCLRDSGPGEDTRALKSVGRVVQTRGSLLESTGFPNPDRAARGIRWIQRW